MPTLINGAGDLTWLGGTLMAPEVVGAMVEAAADFVDIRLLQLRASQLISAATRAEAGVVTAGAAAGLALSASACVCGTDLKRLRSIPDLSAVSRRQILIHRSHVTSYARLMQLCGANLVEFLDEASLNKRLSRGRASAIAFTHERADLGLPIEAIVASARSNGIPVIVDAASALPPVGNLWRYVEAGADIVCFSGGKALHGPQASGFVAGRADLIESISIQQHDCDVHPSIWPNRLPTQGMGRTMKVGKEEIVGLLTALDLYVRRDHEADRRRWEDDVRTIVRLVSDRKGLAARYSYPLPNGRPMPCALIDVNDHQLGINATMLHARLRSTSPHPIVLGDQLLDQGLLVVYPANLREGEARIVAESIIGALAR